MADEMILVEFQHSKQNARLNDGGNQRMPTLSLGDLSSGALWARRPIRQERKEVSDFLKEARQSSKPSECILYGKQMGRPCKSHSVPKLALKNIASSGHVFTANTAPQWQMLDDRIDARTTMREARGSILQ